MEEESSWLLADSWSEGQSGVLVRQVSGRLAAGRASVTTPDFSERARMYVYIYICGDILLCPDRVFVRMLKKKKAPVSTNSFEMSLVSHDCTANVSWSC